MVTKSIFRAVGVAATVGHFSPCSVSQGEFSEKEMKVQKKYLPHPQKVSKRNSWIGNELAKKKGLKNVMEAPKMFLSFWRTFIWWQDLSMTLEGHRANYDQNNAGNPSGN